MWATIQVSRCFFGAFLCLIFYIFYLWCPEILLERFPACWLRKEEKEEDTLANAMVHSHTFPAQEIIQNAAHSAWTGNGNGVNGQDRGGCLSSLNFRSAKGIKWNSFDGTCGVKSNQSSKLAGHCPLLGIVDHSQDDNGHVDGIHGHSTPVANTQ